MTAPTGGGYRANCPACGSAMRIRGSKDQTPTFKTMYGQCSNVACSGSFTGSLTWDYALSPSGVDSPRVVLPVAPAMQRMQALQDSRKQSNQLDLLDAVEATA
jgi:hypothetical protein